MTSEFSPLVEALRVWLRNQGMGADAAGAWTGAILIGLALLLGVGLQAVARTVISKHMRAWVVRTSTGFDDLLYERQVFSRFARVAPGALVFLAAPLVLPDHASARSSSGRR